MNVNEDNADEYEWHAVRNLQFDDTNDLCAIVVQSDSGRVIAMCNDTDAERPPNPVWADSEVTFLNVDGVIRRTWRLMGRDNYWVFAEFDTDENEWRYEHNGTYGPDPFDDMDFDSDSTVGAAGGGDAEQVVTPEDLLRELDEQFGPVQPLGTLSDLLRENEERRGRIRDRAAELPSGSSSPARRVRPRVRAPTPADLSTYREQQEVLAGAATKISTDVECSLCFDPLNINNMFVVPGCGHRFHLTCLRTWRMQCLSRRSQFNCPTCRVRITMELPEALYMCSIKL